jgi:hypothetical protein
LLLILDPVGDAHLVDAIDVPEHDFRVRKNFLQGFRNVTHSPGYFLAGIIRAFVAGFDLLFPGADPDGTSLAAFEEHIRFAALADHFRLVQLFPEALRQKLPSWRNIRLQACPVAVQDVARAAV